jgi:hypothetical protein
MGTDILAGLVYNFILWKEIRSKFSAEGRFCWKGFLGQFQYKFGSCKMNYLYNILILYSYKICSFPPISYMIFLVTIIKFTIDTKVVWHILICINKIDTMLNNGRESCILWVKSYMIYYMYWIFQINFRR